jgi:sulfopyruvate decarboxylase alpha subunit
VKITGNEERRMRGSRTAAKPATGMAAPIDWPQAVHEVLQRSGVRIVAYVPDAGHKRLIELCEADRSMRSVVLTSEEEGVGLAAGAWLGGEKSVLLMQSSGVGNIINSLGMIRECRFPLLMLITMRGEFGEFNPWQVPMGQATAGVLEAMGAVVNRIDAPEGAAAVVDAAARLAGNSYAAVAVLISQRMIGIKSFQEQANQ